MRLMDRYVNLDLPSSADTTIFYFLDALVQPTTLANLVTNILFLMPLSPIRIK